MKSFNLFKRRKKEAILLLFGLTAYAASAQNKSLGVGTNTPNANAALHVESPTNNQGMIMPRLTTAQRTAMASLLTAADNGLMLYDSELKSIFIWDGAVWKTSSEAAGGLKLAFPYKDSVTTDYPVNTPLFHLIDNNPAGSNRIIQLDNLNANAGTALRVTTNSGWAPAGYFVSANDTSNNVTLQTMINTNRITPPGELAPVAFLGTSTGTGALAGTFRIDNADNPFPSLWTETNGMGPAGVFVQLNTEAWTPGLRTTTDAQGAAFEAVSTTNSINARAAEFIVQNNANPRSAVFAHTDGTGPAIEGSTSTGWTALFGDHAGSGTAVYGRSTAGVSGHFSIENTASTSHALLVQTNGMGSTAVFENTNANFNGSSIRSTINTNVAGNAFDGISLGQKGHGGSFFVQNPVNPDPAVTIFTQGMGVGLSAGHLANGIAIEMANGTLKYSSNATGTPGSITQRAGIYNITGLGTYTIDFPTPQTGETVMFFNSYESAVTVNGTQVAPNEVRQFIYIGGAWRPVN